MNASEILAECQRRGIILTSDGETLRYKAPKGAITEDLKSALKENKPAILALLGGTSRRNFQEHQVSDRQLPDLSRPPSTKKELAWLIDYLADPEAFAAWLERLMQQTDPAERSE